METWGFLVIIAWSHKLNLALPCQLSNHTLWTDFFFTLINWILIYCIQASHTQHNRFASHLTWNLRCTRQYMVHTAHTIIKQNWTVSTCFASKVTLFKYIQVSYHSNITQVIKGLLFKCYCKRVLQQQWAVFWPRRLHYLFFIIGQCFLLNGDDVTEGVALILANLFQLRVIFMHVSVQLRSNTNGSMIAQILSRNHNPPDIF